MESGKAWSPFGWMGEQAEHLNAAVQGLFLQRSQHLNGIYERHQKMDERVKQFARVLLDEKKRSAQIGAVHDLRMRTHKKMDRTIQFWTRTIGVYASYKVRFKQQFNFCIIMANCACLK